MCIRDRDNTVQNENKQKDSDAWMEDEAFGQKDTDKRDVYKRQFVQRCNSECGKLRKRNWGLWITSGGVSFENG